MNAMNTRVNIQKSIQEVTNKKTQATLNKQLDQMTLHSDKTYKKLDNDAIAKFHEKVRNAHNAPTPSKRSSFNPLNWFRKSQKNQTNQSVYIPDAKVESSEATSSEATSAPQTGKSHFAWPKIKNPFKRNKTPQSADAIVPATSKTTTSSEDTTSFPSDSSYSGSGTSE